MFLYTMAEHKNRRGSKSDKPKAARTTNYREAKAAIKALGGPPPL